MLTEKLKCTAIATGIEVDLRNWIAEELLVKNSLENLCNENIISNLKYKSKLNEDELEDEDLKNYLDYGQCLEIIRKNKKSLSAESQLIFQELENSLTRMKQVRDRCAHGNLLANDIDTTYEFLNEIRKYENLFKNIFSEYENFSKPDYLNKLNLSKDLDKGFEVENNLPKIDYDETGFIGRVEIKRRLVKTINKNSIIVLTGDAGIGKTSVVLDYCHEIKTKDNEFELLRWFTFKSQEFSNNQIKEINSSFLDKPKEEIKNEVEFFLDQIKSKKCLIVLDNMETILNQEFSALLDKTHEIDHNSKIIITSREPVESGVTIKVEKFEDSEADYLFRKYANYLNLKNLSKQPSAEIKKWCSRRDNNPLGIKLSLDDIYNGSSIEKAFEASKNFLNYSYKNIFDKLSKDSKQVLEMLFYLNNEFTLTSVCTYTNKGPDEVALSLQDLDKKRFLIRDVKNSGAEYFSLRNVIRDFIVKNDLFNDDKIKKTILEKRIQIKGIKSERPINFNQPNKIHYDWSSFYKRKASDDEAINDLENILRKIKKRVQLKASFLNVDLNFKEKIKKEIHEEDKIIMKNLNLLKKKHPNYCEVYRIEGIFYSHQGSVEDMKNSFKKVFELAPDYPNPRGFFIERLRDATEIEDSINEGIKALELFPDNLEIKNQLLMSKYLARNFDDLTKKLSEEMFYGAIEQKKTDNKSARKFASSSLQYFRRYSDFLIKQGGHENYELAYRCLEKLNENYSKLEKESLVDHITTKNVITKAFGEISALKSYFNDKDKIETLNSLEVIFDARSKKYSSSKNYIVNDSFLNKYLKSNNSSQNKVLALNEKYKGKIIQFVRSGALIKLEGEAIIEDSFGGFKNEIFVHKSEIKQTIPVGSEVEFIVGDFKNFFVAKNIRIINKSTKAR